MDIGSGTGLRAAWNAMLGKEVYYAEVCCDKEEAVRFFGREFEDD